MPSLAIRMIFSPADAAVPIDCIGVRKVEIVEQDFIKAKILKLKCDGSEKSLYGTVGGIEPVAAPVVHPECPGIERKRLILVCKCVVWL